jgi:hypothetical protein
MSLRSRSISGFLGVALGSGLLAGCVERSYLITTDQPMAIVYENGKPIGASPVDRTFVYYGKYQFTIVHDGCQTLVVDQYLRAPWYEYPLIDFISENVLPFTIRDKRQFHYVLPRTQDIPPEQVKDAGQRLRSRGQNLGVPLAGTPPAAPMPVAVPVPGAAPLPAAAPVPPTR